MVEFDPHAATLEIQRAVLRRDRDALEALVSDCMVFNSGRLPMLLGIDPPVGKREWIDLGLKIPFEHFDLIECRGTCLGGVWVVTHILAQRISGQEERQWTATDVWWLEQDRWRLAARHPEQLEPAIR